jgi:hypothetical protein
MKIATGTLVLLLLAVPSAFAAEEGWTAYTDISSLSYSEPYTINGILNNLQGGVKSGDAAFTFNKVEAGAQYKGWQVAAFYRYDYYLKSNSDTADVYYKYKTHGILDPSATYNLDLYGSHIEAEGVGIGKYLSITKSFWIVPRVNFLHATQMIDGNVSGQLVSTAQRGLDASGTSGHVDYYTTDDLFGFDNQGIGSPTGEGATLDLHVGWAPIDKLELEAQVDDALSIIRWQDPLHQVFDASGDTVHVDSSGHLSTTPVVTGKNDVKSTYDQTLPVRTRLSGLYNLTPKDGLLAEVFNVGIVTMPQLGYQRKIFDTIQATALYDFQAKAVGLGIDAGFIKASIMSDSFYYDQAHFLSFNLYLSHSF